MVVVAVEVVEHGGNGSGSGSVRGKTACGVKVTVGADQHAVRQPMLKMMMSDGVGIGWRMVSVLVGGWCWYWLADGVNKEKAKQESRWE